MANANYFENNFIKQFYIKFLLEKKALNNI